MTPAARAIGWQFQRQHRLGLLLLAAYLIALWAVKMLVLGPAHDIRLRPPNGMAGLIVAPVSITFFYFVGLFTFGFAGDLAARQSIYPSRMFTLPVTTASLAGWPMLYGTAAAASLWVATALFMRVAGTDAAVPLIWPALLTAVYLAWTQALMWMPYALAGMRVIVAVLWLAAVDTIVLVALHYHAPEWLMTVLLAPQLPLAYAVAYVAVARARRGDIPDWRRPFGRLALTATGDRSLGSFVSAARAQMWFEWRRHGRALPAMVGIVVPCELLLLFIPGNHASPVVFLTLFVVLVTPPVLAVFVAAALSSPNSYGLTRPLTSASLVAAKLKMSLWSALTAWLLVAVFVPLALRLSGKMPVVMERAQAAFEVAGAAHAIAVVALVLLGLFASTWKHLVQSLCIGLTGREWLMKSTALTALLLLVALGPLVDWIQRSVGVQSVIWNGLPWILSALVLLKMTAASWVGLRLYGSRALSDRVLILGAACWLLTVVALYGVLAWLAPPPLFPRYFLGAIAILQVPLVRVSAAPLALQWSRHR